MILRAKYALLEAGEVRRDVRLEVDGARIVSITSGFKPSAPRADIDLGNAVLMPGLVNAHAHLELEFTAGQIDQHDDFLGWLQQIRDMKAGRGNRGTEYPAQSISELLACGCTAVVDHYTTAMDFEALRMAGLRYLPLREYFQFNNHSPDKEQLRALSAGGFAPHAPYTASIEVCRSCRELADESDTPLSTHLAEIPAEIAFVRDGRDPQVEELLRRAGAWDESWRGTGMSPIAWFAQEGILNRRSFAVHANYPQPGDHEILQASGATVVFCPSTHAYFGHPEHPIASYLAAGIPVALGTDSLASNSSLSPLHEAQQVRRSYPQVRAEQVFAAVTQAGLNALGAERELGSLEPGRLADLAAYQLDGDPGPDFAALFDAVLAKGQAALTMVGGKLRHAALGSGLTLSGAA
ncbi:amidohydrolase family protein [bacterium]|nr:amidohydrolase family protein [bacterium]